MAGIKSKLSAAFHLSHQTFQSGIMTGPEPGDSGFENPGELIGNRNTQSDENKDEY